MLSAVFGVVILGNNMKSDQRGGWKVTSRISALVFFDDSSSSGSDCYLLGLGMLLHAGLWILDHTDIRCRNYFLCTFH